MPVDESECVSISNPKTQEFQVVRTSLIPGLLKCLQSNKDERLPQKVFEVQDCVILDKTTDTGARNVRKISALIIDQTANFEVINGLLDLIMLKVGAGFGKHYKLELD